MCGKTFKGHNTAPVPPRPLAALPAVHVQFHPETRTAFFVAVTGVF